MSVSRGQAIAKVTEIQDLVDRTLAGVRRFSRDLRPAVLDDLGLLPALEWLIGELQTDQMHPIRTHFEIVGQPRRLPADVELSLFRIAQEALRNAYKHSNATAITLTASFAENETLLDVTDNGQGFEMGSTKAGLHHGFHLGLLGMQERVQLIGGSLDIRSAPNQGTTVNVSVPY